jgi:SAM-dependent methyltransferase
MTLGDSALGYEVQEWSLPAARQSQGYWEYWNTESIEKQKAWYVLDHPVADMEDYLEEQGLLSQLRQCLDFIEELRGHPLAGAGLDLAAGTLWAVPYLVEGASVSRVYCVEYSEHRLLKLGPAMLRHYEIARDRVVLCLGSFYDLHVPDESMDFVLLSQALHHAENPIRLLTEVARVLTPDGAVIVIGEHVPQSYYKLAARHVLKYTLAHLLPGAAQRRLFGRVLRAGSLHLRRADLFPIDPVKCDHIYSDREYKDLFAQQGFSIQKMEPILRVPGIQSFVLRRASARRPQA